MSRRSSSTASAFANATVDKSSSVMASQSLRDLSGRPPAGGRQLTNRRRCVTLSAFDDPTRLSAVQIKKAIRTAAGEAQRTFSLQRVVDRDEVLRGLVELLSPSSPLNEAIL